MKALRVGAPDDEVLELMKCPISLEIMTDPVSCADGEGLRDAHPMLPHSWSKTLKELDMGVSHWSSHSISNREILTVRDYREIRAQPVRIACAIYYI